LLEEKRLKVPVGFELLLTLYVSKCYDACFAPL